MYESKILGLKHVSIGSIIPFRFGNPREMDDAMTHSLDASLQEFGITRPPLVREVDVIEEEKTVKRYEILNGHHRYERLLQGGLKKIDVLLIDMPSDDRARAFVLAVNNISADWNLADLKVFIESFESDNQAWLQEVTGFSQEDFDHIMAIDAGAGEGTDIAIPVGGKVLVKQDPNVDLSLEHVSFSLKLSPELYQLLKAALKKGKKLWDGTKTNEVFVRILQRFLGEAPDCVYVSARDLRRKARKAAKKAQPQEESPK